MRLSIVIPAFNEEQNIAATLTLLQAARVRGCEIIVVDGGSSDGTMTVAEPLADKVVGSARGRARQMNAGAQMAQGDALLFLHADSKAPTDVDQIILGALNAGSRKWGRFDIAIEGRHFFLPVIGWFMNQRSRLTGIATGDQGLFMTIDAYQAVGGFADIPLMEDVAMCAALKKNGMPLCVKQKIVTSGRRWEKHGVWRTIFLMWRIRLAYFFGADPVALHRTYHGSK
jgi:rSAM/selenodomain-associated transferase 2